MFEPQEKVQVSWILAHEFRNCHNRTADGFDIRRTVRAGDDTARVAVLKVAGMPVLRQGQRSPVRFRGALGAGLMMMTVPDLAPGDGCLIVQE